MTVGFGRLTVFIFLLFVSCGKKDPVSPPVTPPPANTTFANPILNRGPDPWVIKKDSFYYYTHTSGDRLQIWKTKAMSQLSNVSPVTIWVKPAAGANSQDIWAPELHFLNGKWYMYYTAGSGDINLSQRIFVLENSSVDPTTGTWVDKGRVFDATADFWAIDPHVFQFGGNSYLTWSGHASTLDFTQRLYIARLSDANTLATPRSEITSPTYSWEKAGAPPAVNEGPEVILNPAGKPIMIYSASGCWTDGYALGMLVLKDGGDPLQGADWIKNPLPVFYTNSTVEHTVRDIARFLSHPMVHKTG